MTTSVLVAEIAITPVLCIEPDRTLREAAQLLAGGAADTLVVNGDTLTEITEPDVVAAVASGQDPSTPVGEVRGLRIASVQRDMRVAEVAAAMIARGRRSLVVVDTDGSLAGVVHLREVVAALGGATTWVGAFGRVLHAEIEL